MGWFLKGETGMKAEERRHFQTEMFDAGGARVAWIHLVLPILMLSPKTVDICTWGGVGRRNTESASNKHLTDVYFLNGIRSWRYVK